MTNLPPGVTHADIDRAAGADHSEHWPGYLECDHEGAIADIDDALFHRYDDDKAHLLSGLTAALFEKAPTTFEDAEIGELSVWGSGGYELTARWRCPVCGTEHETTDEFGPDPDADR